MPTFKKRKTSRGLFSEASLNNAVKDVLQFKLSIRKACNKYGLDKSMLCRYVKLAEQTGDSNISKKSHKTTKVCDIIN